MTNRSHEDVPTVPTSIEGRRVLVVDDDEAVRTIVQRALEDEGFRVEEAMNGADGIQAAKSRPPDLVILDLGLPDVSGIEVLTALRRTSGVPILVLSGRAEETDRVAALEIGADDYVVKPFFARELAARVRALLRRGSQDSIAERLVFPDLVIHRLAREVNVRGCAVELTAKEFDLLVELASHPRRVTTREDLLRSVWQSSPEWQDPDTVTEHVRRLRRKIEANPAQPSWIRTVRGVGYSFNAEVASRLPAPWPSASASGATRDASGPREWESLPPQVVVPAVDR